MALTARQQALYNVARKALPRWFTEEAGDNEEMLRGYAVLFDVAYGQVEDWLTATFIQTSSGIWLQQLAKDYGTEPQSAESEAQLRERLRNPPVELTPAAIRSFVSDMLTAAGVTIPAGYPGLVELRRDRAHFGVFTSTGRSRAYFSRGYRMSREHPQSFIVILPYGTTAGLAASIFEALRSRRVAGYNAIVERRLVP